MKVFFDESYNDKVFVLSGVQAEYWNSFEDLWNAKLSKYNLSEFHAKDCEHGNGEFEGFSYDDRIRIQEDFLELMCFSPIVGVSIAVILDDLQPLLPELKRFFQLPTRSRIQGNLAEPYLYSFWCSIEFIPETLFRIFGNFDKVEFFFDHHQSSGRATGMFEQVRNAWAVKNCLITHSFEDSKKVVQLQAADMIAYESLKFFDKTYLQKQPYRPQWPYVAKLLGKEGVNYWDRDALTRFLSDHMNDGRFAFKSSKVSK
jgi:hypothetical protein